MRQRKILNDNEWTGWLRIMKSAFEQGTLGEMWESKIEMEKWFDPAFRNLSIGSWLRGSSGKRHHGKILNTLPTLKECACSQ